MAAKLAQGTQRIPRVDENVADDSPITDAEVASALAGEEPIAASRVPRAASAYTTQVIDIRPIIIVA